jgi:hypothetical protein
MTISEKKKLIGTNAAIWVVAISCCFHFAFYCRISLVWYRQVSSGFVLCDSSLCWHGDLLDGH